MPGPPFWVWYGYSTLPISIPHTTHWNHCFTCVGAGPNSTVYCLVTVLTDIAICNSIQHKHTRILRYTNVTSCRLTSCNLRSCCCFDYRFQWTARHVSSSHVWMCVVGDESDPRLAQWFTCLTVEVASGPDMRRSHLFSSSSIRYSSTCCITDYTDFLQGMGEWESIWFANKILIVQ